MILVGNQRGGFRDMADHLLKPDNERVHVHEIRGFMGRDLHAAFQESYAISRATKCKQHLYSVSLNPPKDVSVSEEEFITTIDRAEERLGLAGQPRAIVFHEKRGWDGELRRHAHCVWCRIDTVNMRSIHISYDHRKLESLAHELFLEHGWELPPGFENKQERDPLTYNHAEHQQAKHLGAKVAITSVLHTWRSAMTHHPHIHMIVPGGGIANDGSKWIASRPSFFLSVRVLSRLFRRLFCEMLVRAHEAGQLKFFGPHTALADKARFDRFLEPLHKAEWVVYAKPPFGGPEAVLAYLARYTHRVAISNTRLISAAKSAVTFKVKDYRLQGPGPLQDHDPCAP